MMSGGSHYPQRWYLSAPVLNATPWRLALSARGGETGGGSAAHQRGRTDYNRGLALRVELALGSCVFTEDSSLDMTEKCLEFETSRAAEQSAVSGDVHRLGSRKSANIQLQEVRPATTEPLLHRL
jgi:hypothetical protein